MGCAPFVICTVVVINGIVPNHLKIGNYTAKNNTENKMTLTLKHKKQKHRRCAFTSS